MSAIADTVATTTTRQQDLTDRISTATAAVRHAAREAVESIRRLRETVAPRERVTRRRSARS